MGVLNGKEWAVTLHRALPNLIYYALSGLSEPVFKIVK